MSPSEEIQMTWSDDLDKSKNPSVANPETTKDMFNIKPWVVLSPKIVFGKYFKASKRIFLLFLVGAVWYGSSLTSITKKKSSQMVHPVRINVQGFIFNGLILQNTHVNVNFCSFKQCLNTTTVSLDSI